MKQINYILKSNIGVMVLLGLFFAAVGVVFSGPFGATYGIFGLVFCGLKAIS